MKKYLIIFALLFLSPFLARASNMPSTTPNPITSGSESSAVVNFSSSLTYAVFYLFNPSGISLNTSTNFSNISSPLNWVTAGFPTGLATGTYSLAEIDFVNPSDVPTYNANCGTGNPTSSCVYGTSYYSVVISSGGGGGGSSTVAIAPLFSRTSTAVVAGNVSSEIISFPIFILKTYGGDLVWIAIIFALVAAIYGIIKLVRL